MEYINQKNFTKVKAKKNLYKNNNALLNSPFNHKKLDDNVKNKFIKRSIADQKNLDFINKSEFIKEAVAYSKLRKLKKNLDYKYNDHNNNTEIFSILTQRNENSTNYPANNDIKRGNQYKKIIYDLDELNSKGNKTLQKYNSFYSANKGHLSTNIKSENKKYNVIYNNKTTDYEPNNILRENLNNPFNQNKNILIIDDDSKYNNTERKNYLSIEKLLNKKNKSLQKNYSYNYNTTNTFLNVNVNQIKESPYYDKIKVPKKGHSRGIIEMIKNFNDTSINEEKSKNNYRKKSNDNYKPGKKRIKCLNDQKVFDEPRNKNDMSVKNYSYKKKILKSKNNTTNKKKKNIKKNLNTFNNEDIIINKTINQSFNNTYQFKIPYLTTRADIINDKNENKEDILNNFSKIDNLLYKKYTSNNNYLKKNNSFYKKIHDSKLINIKYSFIPNRKDSKSKIYINNNLNKTDDYNIILEKTKSESESDINNKKNKQRNLEIYSPMLNSKMNNYRKQYLNDNLDDDFLFYQTLPNLASSLNKIREDQINWKNNYKKIEQEKEKNIYNNANNYFYSGDNFPFIKENNNNEQNKIIKKIDNLKENQKKLIKTNSSVNFKKNNLLYLKPKNKQNQNLKSFFYSNYNYTTTNNSNNKSGGKSNNKLSSPIIENKFNESSPTSIKREIVNQKKIKDTNFNNKEYEVIINNENRIISFSKETKKIYKKPIKKNINNNIKMSPKYKDKIIENNSSTYKNEVIYFDKSNVNNNLFEKKNNDYFNDYNKQQINSINNYSRLIKIINKNIKNGYIKKYYNHCIKLPRVKNNYIGKIKFNKKKINDDLMFNPNVDKCYISKISIIKYHKDIIKNKIDNKNQTPKIAKNNKSKEKNIKSEKINKNELNLNIDNNHKLKNEPKIVKYKIKTEKNNIKNEVIYLLNILVQKNILSIENQITKLIITSSHLFNIQKNEDNAKLFLNDIIKNENVFVDILLNKVIIENKFNEIYTKLCSDLCNKYLNSINEIIINKFLDNKNNKEKYNIITNLILKLNEKCIMKLQYILTQDINNESKQKIIYLINFICQAFDYGIIHQETCLAIIYNLFNEFDNNNYLEKKYQYFDLILYLMIKLKKIDDIKDKNKILEKIIKIINTDINSNNNLNIPNILKIRISQLKEIFNIKDKEQNKFDETAILIKEDMENYYNFLKSKKIDLNIKIAENIENKYDWPILKTLKKIDLEEIIKYYINICECVLEYNDQVTCFESYIKNIIESISYKLSLNKLRIFHNKILQIFSNINIICGKNNYMFEIIGYLLYILIINELCDIKDINIFINKDEESIIFITKAIKYTILSSENEENINKFYEDFKNIELFKANDIFEKYITSELRNMLK